MNWRRFDQGRLEEATPFFLWLEDHIFFARIEKDDIFIYQSHSQCIRKTKELISLSMDVFMADYPNALWAHIHLPRGAQ